MISQTYPWRNAKLLRPGIYFVCDAHAGSITHALGEKLPAQGRMTSVWLEIQGRKFRAQLQRTFADCSITKAARGWVWTLSLVRPGDEGLSIPLGASFLFRPTTDYAPRGAVPPFSRLPAIVRFSATDTAASSRQRPRSVTGWAIASHADGPAWHATGFSSEAAHAHVAALNALAVKLPGFRPSEIFAIYAETNLAAQS